MTYFYLISNIDNNPIKCYIGKTINPNHREYNHKQKFGDDIKFEIIEQILSTKSHDWKPIEIKWINHYENLNYILLNKNKGGNGPDFHSLETKDKISQSKLGNHFNLGKKYSNESKNKIKNKKLGTKYIIVKTGINHGNYGKVRNDEWKKKQSISKIGKFLSKEHILKIVEGKIGKGLKIINQYDKQGNFIQEWPSLKSASIKLKIKSGDISSCCNNKQKTAGGFIWKYK